MKTVTSTLAIFLFCFLQVLSVRSELDLKFSVDNWLNSKWDYDFFLKCKLEADYQDYVRNITAYLHPIEWQGINATDYTFHHIYNPSVVAKLKNLVSHIQKCLDPKFRLNSEGEVEVIRRFLHAQAMKILQVNYITIEDWNCQLKNADQYLRCLNNKSIEFKTIYEFLTGAIGLPFTCEEMLEPVKCAMNVFRDCSPNMKNTIKVYMSPPEIPICKNFP